MKALENLLKKYEKDLATFTDLLESCNPNNRLKIEKLRYKVSCHKNMVDDLRSVLAEAVSTESKLNMPGVMARFLTEIATKHNEDVNKVMAGMQYGDLQIWRYDTGAYQVWKTLKVIPKNAL